MSFEENAFTIMRKQSEEIDTLKSQLAEKDRLLQKAVEGLENIAFETEKDDAMLGHINKWATEISEEIRSSVGGGK